jgi:hypothetical protein
MTAYIIGVRTGKNGCSGKQEKIRYVFPPYLHPQPANGNQSYIETGYDL